MDVELILAEINTDLSVQKRQSLKTKLAVYLNDLLLHNFQLLVQLLYRIDVSEQKLKQLLQNNKDTDAAAIIADLIIQRQLEKQKLREQFKSDNTDDNADEKW